MRRSAGFTLTQLIVTLTSISLVAAVALPVVLSKRLAANETAAVATIREFAAAQAQFKAAKRVDVDHDGVGEFAYLKELTGATGLRASADGERVGDVLAPPLLPLRFRALDAGGEFVHGGYVFRMFLPGADGAGVGETELYPVAVPLDARLAADTWCCYAWPTRYGTSGDHVYFVGADGVVVSANAADYSGSGAVGARNCGAALVGGTGPLNAIVGAPAVGTKGRDRSVWTRTD